MRRTYLGFAVLSVALVALLSMVALSPVHSDSHKDSGKAADADAVTMATAPPPDYPHDMKAAAEFLETVGMGFLATVENGMPKLRAWGHIKMEGDRLYFATDNSKAVYQQLKAVPYAEYAVMNPATFRTLRIFGKVVFIEDPDIKKKTLEENDMLRMIFSGEKEKTFEMFYMTDVELNWFAFSQAPEEAQEGATE
jgi:uncharacterized pyridoxamine 5'-phosphate oxidase family protein